MAWRDEITTSGEGTELRDFYDSRWQSYRSGAFRKRRDLRASEMLGRMVRRRRFKDGSLASDFAAKRQRVLQAVALGEPDRVPVVTSGLNFYPAYYAGKTFASYANSRKACRGALMKFVSDHRDFDAIFPSHICCVGPMITPACLDLIMLPGIDLPDDVSYQFVEKERLRPSEYPQLLEGGYEFFKETILPRMSPLYSATKGWDRKTLLRLSAAALAYALSYADVIDVIEREYGVPASPGAFTFAPYDFVSFLFRGLEGISMDLLRMPQMVCDACDMMVDVCLNMAESAAVFSGIRETVILCERAFSLSPRQFDTFYFPSLSMLVSRLIERGIAPLLALEGDCTHVLEKLLGLPRATCAIALDTTDIARAREVLKGHSCIAGNVPMNLLVLGTPDEVRRCCADLLDRCAPGGGFIMAGALGIPDNAKPANVRAMIDYTIEHGEY